MNTSTPLLIALLQTAYPAAAAYPTGQPRAAMEPSGTRRLGYITTSRPEQQYMILGWCSGSISTRLRALLTIRGRRRFESFSESLHFLDLHFSSSVFPPVCSQVYSMPTSILTFSRSSLSIISRFCRSSPASQLTLTYLPASQSRLTAVSHTIEFPASSGVSIRILWTALGMA